MSRVSVLTRLFVVALLLNVVWEFSHCPLYETCRRQPPTQRASLLLRMSLKDSALIVFFYVLSARVFRTPDVSRSVPALWSFIALALGFAFLDETVSLSIRRWEYTAAMPTVFGVGITPLLELALTGAVTLLIVFRLWPLM